MIIFGTRGVTTTPERGNFHCPSCGSGREYARKRVRRFFTLYFIPVIPLDKMGEYIECGHCRGTYRDEVLQHAPGAAGPDVEAEFQRAIKRVMVLVTLADGYVDDAEIETMAKLYGQLTGTTVRPEDLREETRRAQHEGRDVAQYLRDVAPYLNANGKEMIVKAALMVAGSDGRVDEAELQLVFAAGEALEMSTAHVKGVVAELAEGDS